MTIQPIFISVESRKGGVGKTTAALNLAFEFVKRHYAVLLLDCDVTGTSTSTAIDESHFWHDKVNIIKYISKETQTTPFNLLTLLPSEDDFKSVYSQYRVDTINVIGSDLYEKDKLVYDPRILMDELHSTWLVQQLQEISTGFSKHFSTDERPAIVIIDNAPGYMGLSRCIHEWLTDLGPYNSRFLLVSSLDSQDVRSSFSAALEIERLQKGKLRAKRYYRRLTNGDEPNLEEESFLKSNSSFNHYFYSMIEKADIEDNKDEGKQFAISDYIQILFNKVAEECFDKDSYFDFEGCLRDDVSIDLLYRLYGNALDINKMLLIPFDVSLQTQFFGNFIRNAQGDSSEYWVKRFIEFRKNTERFFLLNDVVKAAYSLNGYVKKLRTSLIKKGLSRINAQIQDSWLPAYSFNDLKRIVINISYYSNTYAFLSYTNVKKDDIIVYMAVVARRFIQDNNLPESGTAILSLFEFLFRCAGSRKDNRSIALLIAISLFINTLLATHTLRYNKEDSYLKFLIEETNQKKSVDFLKCVNKPICITKDLVINITPDSKYANILRVCMDKFYKSVNNALIRMLTLEDDFNSLIEVLEWMTTQSKLRTIPKDIRMMLDESIVTKRRPSNKEAVMTYLSKRLEMIVFEQQCKKIFNSWNL